jgi:hypothetical protein
MSTSFSACGMRSSRRAVLLSAMEPIAYLLLFGFGIGHLLLLKKMGAGGAPPLVYFLGADLSGPPGSLTAIPAAPAFDVPLMHFCCSCFVAVCLAPFSSMTDLQPSVYTLMLFLMLLLDELTAVDCWVVTELSGLVFWAITDNENVAASNASIRCFTLFLLLLKKWATHYTAPQAVPFLIGLRSASAPGVAL